MADKLKREPARRSFTIIYNDFIDSEEILSANEKLLYFILLRYGDTVFPSLNTLSRKSGLSRSTVQRTLDKLIEKKLIVKKRRYSKKNGGYTSNIYYLRDSAECWIKNNQEDNSDNLKDTSEERLFEEIKNRPALLERIKKEFSSTDQSKNENTSQSSYKNYDKNYNIETVKSQIDYDCILKNKNIDKIDLDAIVSIMNEIYTSNKDTIRVAGDNKPKDIVVETISRLDREDIISVLLAYEEEQHRGTSIHNHEAYLTTMLYKAKLQNEQRLNNLGRNNNDW